MKAIFQRELKLNLVQFLVWSLAVGLLGLSCILMFTSMEGEVMEMADAFSNMGAFSDAFGMSTLSIATMKGFFSTEVGTVHGLGSAMFAAMLAIGIVSKEEDRHSGEFLLSLPVSRNKVLGAKWICIMVMLTAFTVICGLLYGLGFVMLSESVPVGGFLTFLASQLAMNLEIAGICFCISAASGRIRIGLGLGVVLICYVYDLMGRVSPDLKDYLFLGPYSYCNASEIFAETWFPPDAFAVGSIVTIVCVVGAFEIYNRRDLAS
jgi:ABC-2 type transport system permease protein